MSKKPTIRRTNSADTFSNSKEYNRQRNMSGLLGHHDLSVLAETPSYTTPLNDLISSNSGKKDDLEYHRKEVANEQREAERNLDAKSHGYKVYAPTPIRPVPKISKLLNIPPPGESEPTKRHDDEGLPPAPGSEKSSSKSQKESIVLKKRTIPNLTIPPRQPFSSQTQTFTILNPTATRRTKLPKKKLKGGKNKTKKRKAKKTKKNKKNKK